MCTYIITINYFLFSYYRPETLNYKVVPVLKLHKYLGKGKEQIHKLITKIINPKLIR